VKSQETPISWLQ